MIQSFFSLKRPRFLFGVGLTFGLWMLLWFSILTAWGETKQILHPTGVINFLQGLRATIPYVAVYVAVLIILVKAATHRPRGFRFLGPLGLASVYGTVGIASAWLSPQGWLSLYWTAAYLSVPLMLWALVWGPDSLENLSRIIRLNWALILVAAAGFFTLGLIFLNLSDWLLNPGGWLDCGSRGGWYSVAKDFPGYSGPGEVLESPIRATGVGRYAALAAIIGMAAVWQRHWRALWVVVLLGGLLLLLNSGARTAFVAFVPAAALVLIASGGRKFLVGALASLVVLVPLVWLTGFHNTFIGNCVLAGYQSGTSLLKVPSASPPPAQSEVILPSIGQTEIPSPQASTPDPESSTISLEAAPEAEQVSLSSGVWVLKQIPGPPDPFAPAQVYISEGTWEVDRQVNTVDNEVDRSDGVKMPTRAPGVPTASSPTPDPVATVSAIAAPTPVASPVPLSAALAVLKDGQLQIPGAGWVLERLEGAKQVGLPGHVLFDLTEVGLTLKRISDGKPVAAEEPVLTKAPIPEDKSQPSVQNPIGATASVNPTRKSVIPEGFFTLTGRTVVWEAALRKLPESPWLGFGFHADRLLLGTHMHNAVLHALFQTGLVGAIPLLAGISLGWFYLLKAFRNLSRVPAGHRVLLIQTAGIFVFLSFRAIPESTGAFFGVDWLLLGPLLLYLHLINQRRTSVEAVNPAN